MEAETHEPGMTVSLVARRRGIAPNQLFARRRLASQGALTAIGAEEAGVPASDYRALQVQLREMQRNEVHPHSALGYRAPREFIARKQWGEPGKTDDCQLDMALPTAEIAANKPVASRICLPESTARSARRDRRVPFLATRRIIGD